MSEFDVERGESSSCAQDDNSGRPAVIAEDGLVDIPVVVVAYDPQWPRQFERLRSQVDAALAGVDHATVHVGSTAVPGLDAKPIIDLDVIVADQTAVAAAIDALAAAGWQYEGDLGVPGRDACGWAVRAASVISWPRSPIVPEPCCSPRPWLTW